MGDYEGQIMSWEDAGLANMFAANDEFHKMICKECELAVGLGKVGMHLSRKHGIKMDTARRIANLIDMGEWGCVEGRGEKPKNGTRPQKWLMVFDGLQCRFCKNFQAMSVDEVRSHWRWARHGKAEGAMIEAVRMQSWEGWGGGGGYDNGFWVVEEGLGKVRVDGQIGAEVKGNCKVGKDCGDEEGVEGEQQGKGEEGFEWVRHEWSVGGRSKGTA